MAATPNQASSGTPSGLRRPTNIPTAASPSSVSPTAKFTAGSSSHRNGSTSDSPSKVPVGQDPRQLEALTPGPSKPRPSMGLPPRNGAIGPRRSNPNLRGADSGTSIEQLRSQTPDQDRRIAQNGPSTPLTASRVSALSGRASQSSGTPFTPTTAPPRFNTSTTASRAAPRTSQRFDPPSARGNRTAPPVPPLDARYASQGSPVMSRKTERTSDLTLEDLGAEVEVKDGNEKGYRGVLRYLGEITGKGQTQYAGIELIGGWQGMGKNDGTVAGTQYFATAPQCGMFITPLRLRRVSEEKVVDAVPRPQSVSSGRLSRASEHDVFDRPASATPGKRRSSVAPGSVSRNASLHASGVARTPSRTSTRPDSAMSMSSTTSSRPLSRAGNAAFTPRKSALDEMQEESIANRRAQASEEAIAAAQRRIDPNSRAGQLMNLRAKDIAAAQAAMATPGRPRKSAAEAITLSSPVRGSTSSPLKDALTNKSNIGGSADQRSSRASLGPATGITTPFRPRKSLAETRGAGGTPFRARPSASSASSPPMPMRPPSTLPTGGPSKRESASSSDMRPPSALSRQYQPKSAPADWSDEEDELQTSNRSQKARSLALLEQMDLDATPKKNEQALPSSTSRSASRVSSRAGSDTAGCAEGMIPLSIYEDVYNDLTEKSSQLATLQKDHDELKRGQDRAKVDLEREKKRLHEEQESFKRMVEEEKNVELEDEKRRRAEMESKEKALKAENEALKKSANSDHDASVKRDTDKAKQIAELSARLSESDTLIEELKKAAAKTSAADSQAQANELEVAQLRQRVARLESQLESERQETSKEISELKEAGQETITLYELRLEEAAEDAKLAIEEVEAKMAEQETKHQNAIAEVQRERDERQSSSAIGGAAAIDQAHLQDELAHAQSRLAGLEDSLAEAQAQLETERESLNKRKEKYVDGEARWRAEIKRLKTDAEASSQEYREAKNRCDELQEALAERSRTLENERAEMEALRSEIQGTSNAAKGNEALTLDSSTAIAKLKADLEESAALLKEAESSKQDARKRIEELENELSAQSSADGRVSSSSQDWLSPDVTTQASPSLESSDGAQRLGKASNQSLQKSPDQATAAQRELTGLKTIVSSLSEENAELRAKIRDHKGEPVAPSSSLQERLTALERKNESLTREVSDLEALVESGMWAKEELEAKLADSERKLKRAKEKAAQGVRSVVDHGEGENDARGGQRSVPADAEQGPSGNEAPKLPASDGSRDSKTQPSQVQAPATPAAAGEQDVCDDCGSKDHTLENCPLLDEIF